MGNDAGDGARFKACISLMLHYIALAALAYIVLFVVAPQATAAGTLLICSLFWDNLLLFMS